MENQTSDSTQQQTVNADYSAIENALKAKQDWYFALAGGMTAAVFAALIWALVTVLTKYQIGYMAVGAGFAAGFAVQWFGAGVSLPYRLIGLFSGLIACVLGNVVSQLVFISVDQDMSLLKTLSYYPWNRIISLMQESFSPIDVLFYALAGYTGFKYGARELDADFLHRVSEDPSAADYKYQHLRLPLAAGSVFLLLGSFAYLSQGYSGMKDYTYDSGAKMSEGPVENNVEQGEWTFYFENGGISAKGTFDKGRRSGLWVFFAEDSSVTDTVRYDQDLRQGLSTTVTAAGIVMDSTWYENGLVHGSFVERFPDGTLKLSGTMLHGVRDGAWKIGSEAGVILEEGTYVRGRKSGRWIYRHDNGRTHIERDHAEGSSKMVNFFLYEGEQMVKDGNGTLRESGIAPGLIASGPVKNGKRAGLWKEQYSDGTGEIEYIWRNDIRYFIRAEDPAGRLQFENGTGKLTVYKNGLPYFEVSIADSVYQGVANVLFEDGSISENYSYVNGRLSGPYLSFSESGILIETGSYLDDEKDGLWIEYQEDGVTKTAERTFKSGRLHGESMLYNRAGEQLKVLVFDRDSLKSVEPVPK